MKRTYTPWGAGILAISNLALLSRTLMTRALSRPARSNSVFTIPRLSVLAVAMLAASMVVRADEPATRPSREAPRLPPAPAAIPEAPSGERAFRMVVMSDFNGPYGSVDYRKEVHDAVSLVTSRLKPDLVLSAGDMIAGQRPALSDPQVMAMWGGFDDSVLKPLRAAGVPFYPAAGNHDASGYPTHARDRALYQQVWQREGWVPPGIINGPAGSGYPLNYAFEHDGALVIVMDLTTVQPIGEPQWAWLEQVLTDPALSKLSPKVAVGHVPPYPVALGRQTDIVPPPDNDRLVDRLLAGGVDLLITGHHHAYFKGRARGLNLVSLNCSGDGARPLLAQGQEPRRQSFLVVDSAGGAVTQAFAVHPDGTIIDEAALPAEVSHGPYTLPRFDR